MSCRLFAIIVVGLAGSFVFGAPDCRDQYRKVPEVIRSRGFISEEHLVNSSDGFILTIHRIVNPNVVNLGKPVILQHGLLGSSADWVINSVGGDLEAEFPAENATVGNNLGFELSKRGYDVWMPNARGNTYSMKHNFLKSKDAKFWEFSYNEKIRNDIPAVIDYILEQRNASTVAYIGHSQGTMVMFGLLSTQTQYNDKIKPFIALAPVTTVAYIKSPIRHFAKSSFLMNFVRNRGGRFLPSSRILKFLSAGCPWHLSYICSNLLFLIGGFNQDQLPLERVPVLLAHTPAGTSAWNIVHFGQGVTTKRFAPFDYGDQQKNFRAYGSNIPPEYPLENITNKYIVLFSGANDWLADPQDVQLLKRKLKVKPLLDFQINHHKWNHLDFIWGKDAGEYVNTPVLHVLKEVLAAEE